MKRFKFHFLFSFLAIGYTFLYLPILAVVIYSFNESKRVTIWTKFSTKWYGELFENRQLLEAAWVSLKIAALSATVAVVLGTMAALVLERFVRFKGRTLFGTMVTAPLVMPDVIMGLALLFLFLVFEQLFGWPAGRGVTTIAIAHITLATAYVAVVVRTRLVDFDLSLEEAALDLGAKPLKVFFVITLPIIAPALVAGWLLSFTLSLDDVVIASFLSGPGATTMPMIIFSSVRVGVSPLINAFSTIIITIVTLAVVGAGFMHRRGMKQKIERAQKQ